MSKGQFGARDLVKRLWELPIPEYDGSVSLHIQISEAGAAAALEVAERLDELRQQRGDGLTVTIARRELRRWLRESPEGKTVERLVTSLLTDVSTC